VKRKQVKETEPPEIASASNSSPSVCRSLIVVASRSLPLEEVVRLTVELLHVSFSLVVFLFLSVPYLPPSRGSRVVSDVLPCQSERLLLGRISISSAASSSRRLGQVSMIRNIG
jgi:hypothetical protein